MDNNGIGQFIAELRKEKHLTQKELADRLYITDKAVSKWERGLSCPDITILPEVAAILGVTVDELLSGRRKPVEKKEQKAEIEAVINYAEKSLESRVKNTRKICAVGFSVFLLAGVLVCMVCDLAISGHMTWSLIVISSILYAWIVLFPFIRFGTKGIIGSLIALSFLTLPYLYALTQIIGNAGTHMLAISRRMAAVGFLFIWAVYGLFRMLHPKKMLAAAWSLLLAIPASIAVNCSLTGLLGVPVIDGWDVLTVLLLFEGAAVLFFKGRR